MGISQSDAFCLCPTASETIAVAWIIKLLFGVIRMKEKRAAANAPAPDESSTDGDKTVAEGTS